MDIRSPSSSCGEHVVYLWVFVLSLADADLKHTDKHSNKSINNHNVKEAQKVNAMLITDYIGAEPNIEERRPPVTWLIDQQMKRLAPATRIINQPLIFWQYIRSPLPGNI